MVQTEPYRTLALCYDAVMAHVDYVEWVEFIESVLDYHDHAPARVIELGCGTATFSHLFEARNDVVYLATDASEDMLSIARKKNRDSGITFSNREFGKLEGEETFDTALLLYDGLNYMLIEDDVLNFFRRVYKVLQPGGMFIFDQSTPANSVNNRDYFQDAGESGDVSYVRTSEYNKESSLHTTKFEITHSGRVFQETHLQKCYTGARIQDLLDKTEFIIEAGYDGFSLETADIESERIHWVVRKP